MPIENCGAERSKLKSTNSMAGDDKRIDRALQLKTIIHKPRSVGCSSVFSGDSEVKRSHLLLYLPELKVGARGKLYPPMLVGEVALVHYVKGATGPSEISSHVGVVHERLANVVNLPSNILAIRVGRKGDVFGWKDAWRQVVQFARVIPPDSMKLCLDKNAWMYPDRPAIQLFAAVCNDVLWDNAETFKRWLAGEWLRNNDSREM